MRKIIISVLLILSIALAAGYIFPGVFRKIRPQSQKPAPKSVKASRPERIGEKITYDVRMGKLSLGKAVFNHLSKIEFKGREVRFVTFETKLVRFSDVEKIYSDIETLLPLRVERFISSWPFSEHIIEDYDQEKFILTIKKIKRKKEENIVIKKNNCINNAILLPFFVRDMEDLRVGYTLMARLPTQEFLIELVAEEEVVVPAGKFMAYRFISKPKKFEIWISRDKRRIPLKIKGAGGLGYTLVMKEYSL